MEALEDIANKLDQQDQLRNFRNDFIIPTQANGKECIYFCGNSLGLQPRNVRGAIDQVLDSWANRGVDGHLEGRFPWLPYHEFLTEYMAEIVGALPHEVVIMNSLTTNLHLMMVSFYRPTKNKYKILVEANLFPSDLYAIQSQLKYHGFDPEEGIIFLEGRDNYVSDDDIRSCFASHGHEIALVLIGGVNYYTGQYFNLQLITEIGHSFDCFVGFDLAHGAGNIYPDLHKINADFAVWCTYKYLNSGPGSLSGVFVHERHQYWHDQPRFEGWWGNNKKERFLMKNQFEGIKGAEGWQLSNPPILSMAAIRASLEIFHKANIHKLRQKSIQMSAFFLDCMSDVPAEKFRLITPKNHQESGCQFSLQFVHPDKKYFHSLTSNGIISDWREPDVIRIAPVPLYNTFREIFLFCNILKNELKN